MRKTVRNTIPLLIGSILLAAAPAQAERAPRATGEEKLARVLEGRVAGEPVDCVNMRQIRSTRIIDGTAIVYEASGGKLYVNRPESGAESLNDWDVMVTNTHSNRLCDIDVVRLVNRHGGFNTGLVFLGRFVPYTKPKADRGD